MQILVAFCLWLCYTVSVTTLFCKTGAFVDSIFFEIIGVIAFSLSGALTAMKKEMDIFGACVLGMTTAIGGGVLRDVFSMNLPKIFVKHFYACASIAGALAACEAWF